MFSHSLFERLFANYASAAAGFLALDPGRRSPLARGAWRRNLRCQPQPAE